MAPEPEQAELPPRESIVSGTLFAIAVQITTTIFTAVLTLYLVRALGPEGFGIFGLALGVATLASLVSDLGVSQSAARFAAERLDQRPVVASIMASALRLRIVLATIVQILVVALAEPIAAAYGEPSLAWALRGMALAIFCQSVMQLYIDNFIALGRISRNVWIILLESAAETTASIALVLLGAGAAGATFGRAVGYAIGAGAAVWFAMKLLGRAAFALRAVPGESHTRAIMGYALPLLVTNSAWALFNTIDIILIGALLNATAVGLFSAPLRLTVFLGALGMAVANAVAPRMARHATDPTAVRSLTGSLRLLLLYQTLFLAPLIVWAEPIVTLLLGNQYRESADVLRCMVPYIFLLGLGPTITTSVNFIGKAAYRFPIVLTAVVINVVIDVLLIPEIGIIAAAIGTSAAYLVYVPSHLWLLKRTVRIPLRPLALTLVRCLLAAAAMAGVLVIAGTSTLTPAGWLAGGLAGVLVYVGMLVGTGELKLEELQRAAQALRSRLPGGRPAAPDPR